MNKKFGQMLILASLLALLDQVVKNLVAGRLDSPKFIWGEHFALEYSENAGMAFGIPAPFLFIVISSLILLIALIFLAKKELNMKLFSARIFSAMIIGGALGNTIDRMVNGYVIDFIKIWKWPNFNLADIFIVVGILLTIIFYAKVKNDERRN